MVLVMNPKIYDLKIDVSCDASVCTLPPHLTQCDPQKTRNTMRLKCCACHAKWRWRSPKCCACHEKWRSPSENDAKVLRLLHGATFDTLWNIVLECHKVPRRLPHEMKLRNTSETSESDHFCSTPQRHGHKPHANGCDRLQTVVRRLANTPSTPKPPEWNGNSCYALGKKSADSNIIIWGYRDYPTIPPLQWYPWPQLQTNPAPIPLRRSPSSAYAVW